MNGDIDDALRRCPRCDMKLWPPGQVRPIRFHHLRHTTASLLLMRGADVPAVQKILRHSDPRLTTETYGHLVPGYLRGQIDRLSFGVSPPRNDTAPVSNQQQTVATISPPFAPIELGRGEEDRPFNWRSGRVIG